MHASPSNTCYPVLQATTHHHRKEPTMMTTVLHQLFPRVEIKSYHVEGNRSSESTWAEPTTKELDVHPDELMV